MADDNKKKELDFSVLDDILEDVDLKDVTSEGAGYEELPVGYYLCEVSDCILTKSSKTNYPMIKFTFKIVENGLGDEADEKGDYTLTKELKNTKGRNIFKYYVLDDADQEKRRRNVKTFVSDMMKFEGEEVGKPLLDELCFTKGELLEEALDILKTAQSRLWISITQSERNGEKSSWANPISWARADKIGLPV